MYRRFGKRIIDMAVSAGSLVVLSPLMLLTAGAIKLDSKGVEWHERMHSLGFNRSGACPPADFSKLLTLCY